MKFMDFKEIHGSSWYSLDFNEFHENVRNLCRIPAPTPQYTKFRLIICTVSCDLGDVGGLGQIPKQKHCFFAKKWKFT